MRIAIVYDVCYPYVRGGVEKRLYDISNFLSKEHEVHIFSMKFWEHHEKRKKNIIFHGVCRPKRLYTKSGRRTTLEPLRFSFSLLKIFKYDFDLVECQNFPYFPAFVCKLYSLVKRVPLVVTWHEVWQDYWNDYLGKLGFLAELVERAVARLSNNIIAVSEATADKLLKLGVRPEHITIIPNSIPLKDIRKIKKAKASYDLVFVGRLTKEKHVDVIIRAAAKIKPQPSLAIVGSGPESLALKRLAKRLKLKRVHFFGSKSSGFVYSLMKSSKLFVMPSEREGFCIAALEAMACGMPIITSDTPLNALAQLIKGNGYAVKIDEQILKEKISDVLSNKKLMKKLSEKSRLIANRYDSELVFKRLKAYYETRISGIKNENSRIS